MPNPIVTQCPQGVWTPIALDQIFGFLYLVNSTPQKYLYTYRLTGQPAPTGTADATPIFINKTEKFIISGVGIDIYVMAVGGDGSIRYDWWW